MKIVYEHFQTLDSLLEVLEARPVNKAFINEMDLSSQRDESERKIQGRESWAGSYTYNEAENVLKEGYKEPLEKMKKAILKIGQASKYQRPRPKNDVMGYIPHIPNYLNNIPLSMINRERVAPKTKTIHLIYSFCAAAKTKTADLIKGGINFISLVNSLEKQGYRVKIDIVFATTENNTTACMTVNLKEYGQQVNLLKLAFPLVHVSMLRRFSFRWLETAPGLTERERGFTYGYGMALNFKFNGDLRRERDFLRDNDIIKGENSYYCNVYTALRAGSVEELAAKMDIVAK
jgi:hypothetical protein